MLRYFLLVCFLLSAAFAAWSWLRPYSWEFDPGARGKIVNTIVTNDRSYYWVDVHVKISSGMEHDMQKKIWLEKADGKKIDIADTTFGQDNEKRITDVWVKFWLEDSDFSTPLTLHLNDGKLILRSGKGAPELEGKKFRNFTSSNW